MLQQFVRAIQDQVILDRAAEQLQGPARRAFRRTDARARALKNFLSGTWLGHPLHPIVKDIPIGAWTMAAIFDALRAPDQAMQRAADASIVTGLVGAVASAITGLSDWSDTTGRACRIGIAHAAFNVSAVAMYVSSLGARWSGHRSGGAALAYTGYAIMVLGAYLGGHLVFGEQIGVNHAAQSALPTDFSDVLPEHELAENEPRRVDYNGLPVVLVRQGPRIYALYERCAHLAGPLSQGGIENASIRCPWHGSRFALEDGRVLEGPATNPQPCFETRTFQGNIQIRARERESP
jgi:nitrite reductase/ring-hydroxylating ferredoxin subunit/uncharacterized membrane protein